MDERDRQRMESIKHDIAMMGAKRRIPVDVYTPSFGYKVEREVRDGIVVPVVAASVAAAAIIAAIVAGIVAGRRD